MDAEKKIKFYHAALWVMFVTYTLVVLKLTLIRGERYDSPMLSVVPFKVTADILHNMSLQGAVDNILGNLVLFAPLGFILPVVTGLRKNVVWVGFFFSVAIETTQYFTRLGYADIDDVMFNTVGAWFGFLMYAALRLNIRRELNLVRVSTAVIFLLSVTGMIYIVSNGLLLN